MKLSTMAIPAAVAGLLMSILGCTAAAGNTMKVTHEASEDATGARTLVVEQGDGELRVVGRDGLDEVRARLLGGPEGLADAIGIRRDGDRIVVRQDPGVGDRVVLEIHAPSSLLAEISDGGGETHVEGLAGLDYRDTSGTTTIHAIRGDVTVRDGSGTLELSDIGGRAHVTSDGSGALLARGIAGDLVVDQDTSGPLEATDVTGNLEIGHKTGGAIRAVRVGGDFVVRRHDAGEIHHEEVGGRVDLRPEGGS